MKSDGHAHLRTELAERQAKRHRVVGVVSWTAGNGDRRENAAYQECKRRLRFLDRRLSAAEVVDPSAQTRRDQVFLSATVAYLTGCKEGVTVTLVGVEEASMAEGKISIGSPVALALLDARVGDEVCVLMPRGPEVIEVVDLRYSDLPILGFAPLRLTGKEHSAPVFDIRASTSRRLAASWVCTSGSRTASEPRESKPALVKSRPLRPIVC